MDTLTHTHTHTHLLSHTVLASSALADQEPGSPKALVHHGGLGPILLPLRTTRASHPARLCFLGRGGGVAGSHRATGGAPILAIREVSPVLFVVSVNPL